MVTKRNITSRDLEAAANLTRVYEAKKYGPEKMTQRKLADLMGYKQQVTVSQYLAGKVPMSMETIAWFAHHLGCEPTDIRPDFFEKLPIKRVIRETRLVPVKGTLTGGEPTLATVKTIIKEGSVSDYAVQVDSQAYRKAGFKEGSYLIIDGTVECLVDDDVYVEYADGQKLLGQFMGDNELEGTVIVRDHADGELVELNNSEIRTMDLILGVEAPVRARKKKE